MAYQYCECGAELNPNKMEMIDGFIECGCGRIAYINEYELKEILKQMYNDIQILKEKLNVSK